jgi:transcriptional regulator with XRE-family HTH domain
MSISAQLRKAIQASGVSANSLARLTGVPQPTITQFLQGTDKQASALDKLAEHFGLELHPVDPSTAAKTKVKAPGVPAVDWSETEPEKKRKAEPPPGPANPSKRRK